MKKKPNKAFTDQVLHDIYYDPAHEGSLGSVSALYNAAARHHPKLSQKYVKEWLQQQKTYTLHKPVSRRFLRSRVIVAGIDFQWQADLTSLVSLAKHNRGYKYLLCVIDVLSKYAWVEPLRNKTGAALIAAFKKIFKQGRRPKRLQTDKGTEFLNRDVQRFLKKQHVHFFTTENAETKASIVERFQRTLKSRMWKYFTHRQTYTYIDILQDLVRGYNRSYHRSIKQSPESVNKRNEYQVWSTLYKELPRSPKTDTSSLREGDIVRISKAKGTFEKGYLSNWTEELFSVAAIILRRDSKVYRLKDSSGEILQGTFYRNELQKVIKRDHVYDIDSILKTRKRKVGKRTVTEILVHWKGYPSSQDSWIPRTALLLPKT